MNFKLATGSALAFLASFATANLGTPPTYRAGYKITNANKIGLTKMTENFHVEFSLFVGGDALGGCSDGGCSDGNAWRNILHIGSNDYDRRPALFFEPGSLALATAWNSNDDWSSRSILTTAGTKSLEIGFTYQVSMMMLNNHFYFCVDDFCQDTTFSGTNYQEENVEIWASAPRDFQAPNFYSNPDSENFGRIDNLMIREVIEYGVLGAELIQFMSQSN